MIYIIVLRKYQYDIESWKIQRCHSLNLIKFLLYCFAKLFVLMDFVFFMNTLFSFNMLSFHECTFWWSKTVIFAEWQTVVNHVYVHIHSSLFWACSPVVFQNDNDVMESEIDVTQLTKRSAKTDSSHFELLKVLGQGSFGKVGHQRATNGTTSLNNSSVISRQDSKACPTNPVILLHAHPWLAGRLGLIWTPMPSKNTPPDTPVFV